jgi:purine-cytosine permease-like protein
MKVSAYWCRPRPETKSAACSADHSVIRPVGLPLLSLLWVKVVGVCSVLVGPESVGELSAYSTWWTGMVGLWITLRSYSSSASASESE